MIPSQSVNVGARTSPLSLAQAEEILSQLRGHFPSIDFVVVTLTTGGDRNKEAPLQTLERGSFVKEIETALMNGDIDFAVHSAKDLTSTLPDGLTIAAVGRRRDPRDVQVNRWGLPLMELPPGARLGTSSPRRFAQIKAARPDLRLPPIRGNVGTRLDKARGADYDGVVLAAAGLLRLGKESEATEFLSPELCTPEVGQGALAVEARESDGPIIDMLARIDHAPSSFSLRAERAFQLVLGGGCTSPVAAYARLDGGQVHIIAMAALPDGSRLFRTEVTLDADEPEAAGRHAAEALLKAGASEVLDDEGST